MKRLVSWFVLIGFAFSMGGCCLRDFRLYPTPIVAAEIPDIVSP